MLTACRKCINLERMRIGKFIDGDLMYPITGRKLGYNTVNPIPIPFSVDKGRVHKPFAELPLMVKSSSTLKTLDIQVCSRATLWRLISRVNENTAVEVFIVRCDDWRLESGCFEGAKSCHLFLAL